MQPTLSQLGLEADNTKEDALNAADQAGATFMSIFTTFGSFSIAAGILLIFLIFVMLAAERRSELGIARAVGTRRGHLVQMFLFEGVVYDLIAAAVGVLVGVAVAYGMVLVMASAFGTVFGDFDISYSVKPVSLVLAYTIGVLLTLAVVAFSAWRVSRMNIVTAIRDLPDPPVEKGRRRRWILGIVGVVLGGLIAVSGVSGEDAVVLGLGVSLIILSFVPILHALGVPDRVVHTGAGLALVIWFVLPISRWLFGDLKLNFSIFLLGGLMIVIGATWTIVYNADVLLGALASTLGRIRALAPILRMSIAYPLRSVFRTGVTLAMFTLVVFTLVVGAITTSSFLHAIDNVQAFGGGFDIRATASPASPIVDMPEALRSARGVEPADFRVVSSVSDLPVDANQVGAGREAGDLRRPRGRPRIPHEHDLQPRREGLGVRLGRGGLAGGPRRTEPRGRRSVRRAAKRELGLRPDARVPPDRLLPRGQGIHSDSRTRAGSPDREGRHAPRRRSPFRHHSRAYGRHLDLAVHARARCSATA